jgi:N-acetylglucosamine-6-phosphate deacetylase
VTLTGELLLRGPLALGGARLEAGALLIGAGEVRWSGPAAQLPAELSAERELVLAPDEGTLVPGFVDLHVHGAAGADAADGSAAALETICRAHAAHGTTALCPTVLTAPPEVLLAGLDQIRQAAGRAPVGGARVIGAHLEGPFLSPARAGAQPPEHLRAPDPALLEELLDAGGEALRIVTLAPELPGALALVERLVERGVVAALGHTNATWEQVRAAVDAGCTSATHTFNAMRGLHHREAGALGAVLDDARLTAEVIADGIHVSGPALRLAWRLKGPDRLSLITDCTAALEAPAGQARLGDQLVHVEGGAVRLPDGTLAGSSLTMERAVANLIRLAGADLASAARAAAEVPCALLGLPPPLHPGSPADLVWLDPELRPRAVLVGGEVVFGEIT